MIMQIVSKMKKIMKQMKCSCFLLFFSPKSTFHSLYTYSFVLSVAAKILLKDHIFDQSVFRPSCFLGSILNMQLRSILNWNPMKIKFAEKHWITLQTKDGFEIE